MMSRLVRVGLVVVLLAVLIVVLIPIMMRVAMSNYLYVDDATLPKTQVAIVLGASVVDKQPSPILAARADAAIKLYLSGKVAKILVTGDNGELSHDEVTPVRKYLLDAGVKPEDIFLDHAGFDTYSSMYRAQAVFAVSSAVIVTQDFHLPRAVFIARHLGIEAYGYDAGGPSNLYNYLREIPASAKAFLDLLTKRFPKYLGEQFPITGDGQPTWY